MIVMDATALDLLLTGNTHVLAMAGGVEAAIYYQDARRAHMALPDGTRRTGRWAITASGYHVDWENGPSADWQIDVEPGMMRYRDAGGTERARVARIVPGDERGLAA